MKKIITLISFAFIASYSFASVNNSVWNEVHTEAVPTKGERKLFPDVYKVFSLNDAYLKNLLFQLPETGDGTIITLPAPDGSSHNFRVWQAPVMMSGLAAKYPGIRNFSAVSMDNPAITAKVNYTYKGFNAMVYDGRNSYFIDPYTNSNEGYYICYYKKDYPYNAANGFTCATADEQEEELQQGEQIQVGNEPPVLSFKVNGSQKKTFRMALTCTGEYAEAVAGPSPLKSNVLSAMVTSLSRINGIFQRELSITFQLIDNNDTLIYLDPATDSFTSLQNNSISGSTQDANQTNTDLLIGAANYDIGHIFCSGNNGVADFEGLCDPGHAARAATGRANPVGDAFDIDYVAHEIGHQVGAKHTFNYMGLGCGPHGVLESAFEPGSGSTIMAYAGLCSGNNIQQHSDDYFHSHSLYQISEFVYSTNPLTCGSTINSWNNPPTVADIVASYNIPHKTPFELQAPEAVDLDNDVLNYCWEQYDLGDFGKSLALAQNGPIIRSFKPDTSRWRIFPRLDSVKRGTNSYILEKMPEITRELNFRLTVLDMLNGWGTFHWSDTTVTLYATDQSGPFVVQSPNNSTAYWQIGQTYTVTWDVANTTAAPVSCANVDIYLSLDDGNTWPVTLAANTANDGSESITVPAGTMTPEARIKVKGSGNVFFDMSNAPFRISLWPQAVTDIDGSSFVEVYPVPAKDELHVKVTDANEYEVHMLNSVGQTVWNGAVKNDVSINVAGFAAGVYHLCFVDNATGNKFVKKVVVQ